MITITKSYIFRISLKVFNRLIIERKKSFVALTIISLIGLIIEIEYLRSSVTKQFYLENYLLLKSPNDRGVCKLPLDINPFDDSVKPYIKKLVPKIVCKNNIDQNNDYLTYIDSNNTLRINSSTFVDCSYQYFNLQKHSDDQLVYSKSGQINSVFGQPMGDNEFVNVTCFQSNGKVYKNFHYVVPKVAQNIVDNEYHPSVLILVIESMSRINFNRHMTNTRRELERLGNITYLKGLTKIADNSFPNMVPFLTGKRAYSGELKNDERGPYDDWPFIWKKFKSKGYSTALIEDYPLLMLFNFEAKGFIEKKPTDFYTRPLWLHMKNHIKDEDFCLDHKIPIVDIFLDKVKTFVRTKFKETKPSFTFAFLIEMTHEELNNAQIIDTHFASFIKQLRNELKDMVFILMGDHGNRFGPILNTVIGRIEERMPLFAIRLPQTLTSKNTDLTAFLNENSDKLISWLDLYQLLLDIVNSNYSPNKNEESNHRPEVFSPWRQSIPHNRTCKQALIPDLYCVCHQRKSINTDIDFVVKASLALVRYINNKLPQNLCHTLTLNSTNNAEVILPSESSVDHKNFEQVIEITILVNPSYGQLRAQLSRNAWSSDWSVRGDVNRINKYGNQSHCIEDKILKKYCYCRIQ